MSWSLTSKLLLKELVEPFCQMKMNLLRQKHHVDASFDRLLCKKLGFYKDEEENEDEDGSWDEDEDYDDYDYEEDEDVNVEAAILETLCWDPGSIE